MSRCEAISRTGAVHYAVIGGFQQKTTDLATLLGAPLSTGSAMSDCLQARRDDLTRAVKRLKLVSAHDALVLLKNSLSAPKLLHTLRSACCVDHDLLKAFDDVSSICNVSLTDDQWLQASLPVRNGGLGLATKENNPLITSFRDKLLREGMLRILHWLSNVMHQSNINIRSGQQVYIKPSH